MLIVRPHEGQWEPQRRLVVKLVNIQELSEGLGNLMIIEFI